MAADRDALIKALRALVREAIPELHGIVYAVKGRVIKVYEAAGPMGSGRAAYAVDVQVLDADGLPRQDLPPLANVELPVIWAGPGRGIYCLPPVGAIVRVGFYYGDPSRPYVAAVLGDGYEAPAHPVGELVIQQADGVQIRMEPSGRIVLRPAANQPVRVEGDLVATGTILANQP